MEHDVIKDPELVVAIDVGSTYSGYAWQWREDFKNKGNIQLNSDWDTGSVQLYKTTSCILLEYVSEKPNTYEKNRNDPGQLDYRKIANDYRIDSFGQRAELKYEDLLEDDPLGSNIIGKYYFLSNFKHVLSKTDFKDTFPAEDKFGQHIPLVVVMSKFIEAFKNDFLTKHIKKGYAHNIEEKILWIVTVPAIWSHQAKKLMRVAAEMSGIKHSQLLLAKEPEAAVVHCMFLSEEERASLANLGFPGQTFLVADLGGLTVDLCAVKVKANGKLDEVSCSNGMLVGGQNVNQAFLMTCYSSFKDNGWQKLRKTSLPSELLEMERDFEAKKLIIGKEQSGEKITLRVPHTMLEELSKNTVQLKDDEETKDCFSFDKGKLSFRSEFIRKKLFETTLSKVFELIKTELEKHELKECSVVVLVGGFVESNIVKCRLEEMIHCSFPNIKVVSPTSPFLAVMKGAVLFGHNPGIFSSRKSDKTFGIKTKVPFDSKKHDETKKFRNEETGELQCLDNFSIHVKRGQSVNLEGEHPVQIYKPTYSYQTEAKIEIYSTQHQNPTYVTDPGCQMIDVIEVDMSDTRGGFNREVAVTIIYGGTELSVKVINKATGKKYNAEYNWNAEDEKFVCKMK